MRPQILHIAISFLLLLGFSASSLKAQSGRPIKVAVDHQGIPIFKADGITVNAKAPNRKSAREFRKRMKKFNKLRYNILKVWPYAQVASVNLKRIHEDLEAIPEDEHKAYLKSKENKLFGKYEKGIRNLTFSQGHILIKLIDRQTGNTTYSVIQDLKNGATAWFWQTLGGLFGYNLKTEYDPKGKDFEMEAIVQSIEQGKNVSYYDIYEARGY